MREIKFRAWDNGKNKFVGDFKLFNLAELVNEYANAHRLEFLEFVQYTGLLDKNGVEIYEGDICGVDRFDGSRIEQPLEIRWVSHNNVGAGFNIKNDGNWLEVIGNIYENPELLK